MPSLTPWPKTTSGWAADDPRVAVVVASHNTCELLAMCVHAAFRALPAGTRGPVVVVDNGSSDGTVALLQGAVQDGLVQLIANDHNRYHGPALNQGIDLLARGGAGPADLVWVLDSDCVLSREAWTKVAGGVGRARPAVVGEDDGGSLALNSLVIDPAQVWREGVGPFRQDGDPARHLLAAAAAADLDLMDLPMRARAGFCTSGGPRWPASPSARRRTTTTTTGRSRTLSRTGAVTRTGRRPGPRSGRTSSGRSPH